MPVSADVPPFLISPPAYIRRETSGLIVPDAKVVPAMLPGMGGFLGFVPQYPAITQTSINYVGGNGLSSLATTGSPATYTIANAPLGEYHPQRVELIVFAIADTAATVTGVSIGGQACEFSQFNLSTASLVWAANNTANAATGGQGNIVITLSAADSSFNMAYSVYRILAANSRTKFNFDFTNGGSATTTAAANGVAVMWMYELSGVIGNSSYVEDNLRNDFSGSFDFRSGRVAPTSSGTLSTSSTGTSYVSGVVCWN